MNMTYNVLNTLLHRLLEEGEELGVITSFKDLPQSIVLDSFKVRDHVYASVSYQTDQDHGEEPDEPIQEARLFLRVVEDIPEEKRREDVIDAVWRFTAKGFEQERGELSDLEAFMEMLSEAAEN
ncbi:MAG: hypothetical protein IBX50_05030 [Marinospirillum sp.]|uniref:hypothetical protein n=1 Tax=Marinospirillum sp. TaxID=2183934 RepID=UPI0019E38408|nr:hypothetical protein [Marinospirillum sp.]MBE0506071.1 hypothetical protein [Marinospirillum sp.]